MPSPSPPLLYSSSASSGRENAVTQFCQADMIRESCLRKGGSKDIIFLATDGIPAESILPYVTSCDNLVVFQGLAFRVTVSIGALKWPGKNG
jgi:hypothetical protein